MRLHPPVSTGNEAARLRSSEILTEGLRRTVLGRQRLQATAQAVVISSAAWTAVATLQDRPPVLSRLWISWAAVAAVPDTFGGSGEILEVECLADGVPVAYSAWSSVAAVPFAVQPLSGQGEMGHETESLVNIELRARIAPHAGGRVDIDSATLWVDMDPVLEREGSS